MSERWKPKHGDTFWYVSEIADVNGTTWLDDGIDPIFYESGNCFQTEEEAEAAAKKVKALLLSLHEEQPVTDCDQLPKLTAEVFDRPDCPEWAKYAAVDGNGYAYYSSERPFILSDEFGWGIVCGENSRSELIPGKFTHINWSESRIKRPTKLPDWCKVGEWIYTSSEQYLKINGISVDLQKIELSNGATWSKQDIIDEAVPARLRPYNKRCFKLEHRENGEWVE